MKNCEEGAAKKELDAATAEMNELKEEVMRLQFTFFDTAAGAEQFGRSIYIAPQEDYFNSVRTEYSDMLKNQLSKGNNGLVKTKYVTFGIEADNPRIAKHRLERMETDISTSIRWI